MGPVFCWCVVLFFVQDVGHRQQMPQGAFVSLRALVTCAHLAQPIISKQNLGSELLAWWCNLSVLVVQEVISWEVI